MIKHYCDICGKKMQDKTVMQDTDPLDYQYGECRICFDIGLQGIYEVGFDEICHECERRIANIDMDDFHEALMKLMGLGHPTEKGETERQIQIGKIMIEKMVSCYDKTKERR